MSFKKDRKSYFSVSKRLFSGGVCLTLLISSCTVPTISENLQETISDINKRISETLKHTDDTNILKEKSLHYSQVVLKDISSQMVSSKGAEIKGGNGLFSYSISEKSLTKDVELKVTPIEHSKVSVGFDFKPDGQTFIKPSIMTAKLPRKLKPKQLLQVYSLDKAGKMFPAKLNDKSPIYAKVMDDGETIEFEIDHYSAYIIPDEILQLAEFGVDGTETFTREYIDLAQDQGWMSEKSASNISDAITITKFAAQAFVLQESFKDINNMNYVSDGGKTLIKSCYVIDSIKTVGGLPPNIFEVDIGPVCSGIFELQNTLRSVEDNFIGFLNSLTIDVGAWANLTVELIEPLSPNIDVTMDNSDIFGSNLAKNRESTSTVGCALIDEKLDCTKSFGDPGSNRRFAVPYGLYKVTVTPPIEILPIMANRPVVSQNRLGYFTLSPSNGREHQTIKISDLVNLETKLGRDMKPSLSNAQHALLDRVKEITPTAEPRKKLSTIPPSYAPPATYPPPRPTPTPYVFTSAPEPAPPPSPAPEPASPESPLPNKSSESSTGYVYEISGGKSTEQGGGTWGSILKMVAEIDGDRLSVTVSKKDGSAFSGYSNRVYLKVGTYESYGVNHSMAVVHSGRLDFSLYDGLRNYSTQWEPDKKFYVRVENSGGHAWVGPIKVIRKSK